VPERRSALFRKATMSKRWRVEDRRIPFDTEPTAELGVPPVARRADHIYYNERRNMFWTEAVKTDQRTRTHGEMQHKQDQATIHQGSVWDKVPQIQAAYIAADYSDRAQQKDCARLRAALGFTRGVEAKRRAGPQAGPHTSRRRPSPATLLSSPRACTARFIQHPSLTPRGELLTAEINTGSSSRSGRRRPPASSFVASTYQSDYGQENSIGTLRAWEEKRKPALSNTLVPKPPSASVPTLSKHQRRTRKVTQLLGQVGELQKET